jgi:O-antigen/teichoic acid export membrane protein
MKKFLHKYSNWNWALLDQGMVSGVNFLVGILLVRYLGLEQYGVFVLVWMMVQFILGIQNALIISPMMSIAPKIPIEERSGYYTTTFVLQGVLVLFVIVTGAIYLFFLSKYKPVWLPQEAIWPMLSCFIFVLFQDYIRRNLFSNMDGRHAFYFDIVAYGGQLSLIFFVVKAYPSFETALLVIAVSMFASIAVGFRWMKLSAMPDGNFILVTKRHWNTSKWLLGSTILQWLSGNYFLIVAAALLGPAIVGAIRAAQNLLGLTHILFQGLENVVPHEASLCYHERGPLALRRYLTKVSLLLLVGTGLIATVAAIFAEPLLRLVYGNIDQSSVTAMMWYVPIYVLVAAVLPLRAGLRSLEQTRAIFVAYVVGAIFSIMTANFFIAHYAVNGVMAGILFVQIIMTLILSISLFSGLKTR